eukprot:4484766-Pleurochrysis_carterae.AAC.2
MGNIATTNSTPSSMLHVGCHFLEVFPVACTALSPSTSPGMSSSFETAVWHRCNMRDLDTVSLQTRSMQWAVLLTLASPLLSVARRQTPTRADGGVARRFVVRARIYS